MGSQNEATQDTGKPNARAGHRDVVKGLENRRKEGAVMRNWKYDGWAECDWVCLTDDSTEFNALAKQFDNAIGGGGGGFTPGKLKAFQERVDAMTSRFREILNSYY